MKKNVEENIGVELNYLIGNVMVIMNSLKEKKYNDVDDFLTFLSIYEDKNRISNYKRMLLDNVHLIKDKICVDAGCGLGIFSEFLVELGAKKVYSVEKNPYMYEYSKKRLMKYENIVLVKKDIISFKPKDKIDTLIHEFYGNLLYDEELYLLNKIQFSPENVIPNGGKLLLGAISKDKVIDDVIDEDVLNSLQGILVMGLFDNEDMKLKYPILEWSYNNGLKNIKNNLDDLEGDVLYFGVEITHNNQSICKAEECDNWSYVWTYKKTNNFDIRFVHNGRFMECDFRWI